MINENFLYPFSELDATAKEKAKILVENQPYRIYLPEVNATLNILREGTRVTLEKAKLSS